MHYCKLASDRASFELSDSVVAGRRNTVGVVEIEQVRNITNVQWPSTIYSLEVG
jgi:hypothetical protein